MSKKKINEKTVEEKIREAMKNIGLEIELFSSMTIFPIKKMPGKTHYTVRVSESKGRG